MRHLLHIVSRNKSFKWQFAPISHISWSGCCGWGPEVASKNSVSPSAAEQARAKTGGAPRPTLWRVTYRPLWPAGKRRNAAKSIAPVPGASAVQRARSHSETCRQIMIKRPDFP